MIFSSIRARTLVLIGGLLLGATAPMACKRMVEPGVTSQQQAGLLASLPREMRQRIEQLLDRGFNPCPDVDVPFDFKRSFYLDEDPALRDLKYKSALLEKEGRSGELNCLATVAWVIDGEKSNWVMQAASFLTKLKAAEYRKVKELILFETDREGYADRVVIDLEKETFKPGDVLVFTRGVLREHDLQVPLTVDDNAIAHAAIYLGQAAGKHYMFQKWNSFCGPKSPYEVMSLDYYVQRRIGYPTAGQDNGSFTHLLVFHPTKTQ